MLQYICDHNSGKNSFDFRNFCTAVSRKNIFTHTWKTCSPQLNNVLTLPCESETLHFILFWCTLRILPTASSVMWNIKLIKYRETNWQSKVCPKCPPMAWHKHASVVAIGQLRHQSATAQSLATHAADASMSWTWQWRHSYVTCKKK